MRLKLTLIVITILTGAIDGAREGRAYRGGKAKYRKADKKGETQFQHHRTVDGAQLGCFGYVDGQGKLFVTHYIADESGYRWVNLLEPEKQFLDRVKSFRSEGSNDVSDVFPVDCTEAGDLGRLREMAKDIKSEFENESEEELVRNPPRYDYNENDDVLTDESSKEVFDPVDDNKHETVDPAHSDKKNLQSALQDKEKDPKIVLADNDSKDRTKTDHFDENPDHLNGSEDHDPTVTIMQNENVDGSKDSNVKTNFKPGPNKPSPIIKNNIKEVKFKTVVPKINNRQPDTKPNVGQGPELEQVAPSAQPSSSKMEPSIITSDIADKPESVNVDDPNVKETDDAKIKSVDGLVEAPGSTEKGITSSNVKDNNEEKKSSIEPRISLGEKESNHIHEMQNNAEHKSDTDAPRNDQFEQSNDPKETNAANKAEQITTVPADNSDKANEVKSEETNKNSAENPPSAPPAVRNPTRFNQLQHKQLTSKSPQDVAETEEPRNATPPTGLPTMATEHEVTVKPAHIGLQIPGLASAAVTQRPNTHPVRLVNVRNPEYFNPQQNDHSVKDTKPSGDANSASNSGTKPKGSDPHRKTPGNIKFQTAVRGKPSRRKSTTTRKPSEETDAQKNSTALHSDVITTTVAAVEASTITTVRPISRTRTTVATSSDIQSTSSRPSSETSSIASKDNNTSSQETSTEGPSRASSETPDVNRTPGVTQEAVAETTASYAETQMPSIAITNPTRVPNFNDFIASISRVLPIVRSTPASPVDAADGAGSTPAPSALNIDIYDEVDEEDTDVVVTPSSPAPTAVAKPATTTTDAIGDCEEVVVKVPADAKHVIVRTDALKLKPEDINLPKDIITLIAPGVYDVKLRSFKKISFEPYNPVMEQKLSDDNKIPINLGKYFNYDELVPTPKPSSSQENTQQTRGNLYLPEPDTASVKVQSPTQAEAIDLNSLSLQQRELLNLMPLLRRSLT